MQIKETQELLKGLEILAIAGAKIAKDKKIDLSDVKPVLDAVKEYSTILEGFKGLDQVIPEVKDIDQVEAAALGFQLIELVKKVKAELAQ